MSMTMHPVLNYDSVSRGRSRSSPATLIALKPDSSSESSGPFTYNKEQQRVAVVSDLIGMEKNKKDFDHPTQFLMNKMKKRVEEVGLSPRYRSTSLIMSKPLDTTYSTAESGSSSASSVESR